MCRAHASDPKARAQVASFTSFALCDLQFAIFSLHLQFAICSPDFAICKRRPLAHRTPPKPDAPFQRFFHYCHTGDSLAITQLPPSRR
jgi:hypothetical protein